MPVKTPQFIATKPDDNGNPIGGGYQCTVCGLTTLTNGEPHISAAGKVCYPAPEGQPILVTAGPRGSVIRTVAPAPETPADVRKAADAARADLDARMAAAKERENAALEARRAAEAAEEQAAAELAATVKESNAAKGA